MLKTLITLFSFALWFIVSLFFIVAPFTLLADELPALFQLILFVFGTSWLVLLAFVSMYARYYVKVGTDEALLRTGAGDELLIIDGGTIVIPLFHKLIRVSLRTDIVDVSREGENALMTADNLPADIRAQFVIRVQKVEEDIKNAAKALGGKASEEVMEDFKTLFEGAMAEVVANFNLIDLHEKRQKFAVDVKESANVVLPVYGYTLEDVKITYLAQGSLDEAKMTGVFGKRGSAILEEMTARAWEEETKARKRKIALDADLNYTRRKKEGEIAEQEMMVIEAERNRDVARIEAEQAKAVRQELANVAVGRQKVVNEEELAKRKVRKEEAVEIEAIERDQRVESREIEKEMAVMDLEKVQEQRLAELALQQGERRKAEAERERQTQQVKTVEVVETEEREKRRRVIAAEGALEAAKMQAEGDKVGAMVPVEVERRKIEVRQSDLRQKEEYKTAALDFELKKAGIQAEVDVRQAIAAALGEGMKDAKITLFGDSETAMRLGERFMTAVGTGAQVRELMSAVTDDEAMREIGVLVDLIKRLWQETREGGGKEELRKDLESFFSGKEKHGTTSETDSHVRP